jgi:hypothetical protein
MAGLSLPLAHHSEPIDPDLWVWLSTKMNHVLGVDAGAMVLILGAIIVLFPIVVMVLVWRKRRAG